MSMNTAPYKDNDTSIDQSKNDSELQIDPNPFARRDKSRRTNERSGREKRSRMRSSIYDEGSIN